MMLTMPTMIPLPQPLAQYLVLDIETGDAPPEAVAAALDGWRVPSNVKRESTAERKRQEAADRIQSRASLLDRSPVLCVGIQTDRCRLVLNGMDTSTPEINCWSVVACASERGLLLALRTWLDFNTGPETILVGHNIRNFDLPKLRGAYVRHRLNLPAILRPRLKDEATSFASLRAWAEVVDTAALFKAFSMEHRDDFCPSLDSVAASFGIPRPKTHMNGADVPKLHQQGRTAEILTYCCCDVSTTTAAFRLMTSTSDGLE